MQGRVPAPTILRCGLLALHIRSALCTIDSYRRCQWDMNLTLCRRRQGESWGRPSLLLETLSDVVEAVGVHTEVAVPLTRGAAVLDRPILHAELHVVNKAEFLALELQLEVAPVVLDHAPSAAIDKGLLIDLLPILRIRVEDFQEVIGSLGGRLAEAKGLALVASIPCGGGPTVGGRRAGLQRAVPAHAEIRGHGARELEPSFGFLRLHHSHESNSSESLRHESPSASTSSVDIHRARALRRNSSDSSTQ
mmetsp:Transcript_22069/g.41365  ORF Transcript_22069/g.41365 Transcript_22069/m.41365 type:complete len:250 (+) Transcript_22069:60-809(+)